MDNKYPKFTTPGEFAKMYDERTKESNGRDYSQDNPLILIGDPDTSIYLKQINKKCDKLGLSSCFINKNNVIEIANSNPNIIHIIDTAYRKFPDYLIYSKLNFHEHLNADNNIPTFKGNLPATCCAEAIYIVLYSIIPTFKNGCHILVVGRGPSVKGLQELLTPLPVTTSYVNSSTNKRVFGDLFRTADIIVNAAPVDYRNILNDFSPNDNDITVASKSMIIDLSGSFRNITLPNTIHDIGKLTVSVAVNRYVNKLETEHCNGY